MAQIEMGDDGRTATIRPRAPYDFVATVRLLQRRITNRVDVWEDDAYWRVLELGGDVRLVSIRNLGTITEPVLSLRLEGEEPAAAAVREAAATVGTMLGVDADVAPFFAIAAADPDFGAVAGRLLGLRPPRFPGLFETFVNVVTFQQISLHAALAITGRLAERYGRKLQFGGRTRYAAPGAGALARAEVEELRHLGLSLRKAEVLRALAQRTVAADPVLAQLDALPSPEAAARLTTLPGIGRWSAEVILLRGFGRLDVFPMGDAGVDRGLAGILGRSTAPAKPEQAALVERFGLWRGMLYFLIASHRLLGLPNDVSADRIS